MQRTYRERKHICGDYMEVEIFPVYTNAKRRGKRKKPTSEIQQRLERLAAQLEAQLDTLDLSSKAAQLKEQSLNNRWNKALEDIVDIQAQMKVSSA